LRHAFATVAMSVLPSTTPVSKVLGHRKEATTRDLYGHLRDDDSRAVADAVSASRAAARANSV
jgi:integrase